MAGGTATMKKPTTTAKATRPAKKAAAAVGNDAATAFGDRLAKDVGPRLMKSLKGSTLFDKSWQMHNLAEIEVIGDRLRNILSRAGAEMYPGK